MSRSISERSIERGDLSYLRDPLLCLATQVSTDHRPATLTRRHRPLWHTASDVHTNLLYGTHVSLAHPALAHFACMGV